MVWGQLLYGLLFLLGGYCVVLGMVYVFQSRLLFFPEDSGLGPEVTPEVVDLTYETVQLTTEDGLQLHGWFIPGVEKQQTLLFCHGNAGNITHRLDSLFLFHTLGYSVLIFDYRGYGRSEGKPSEAGLYMDVEAAWDYLVQTRRIPAADIVLFGRSLGAAVAAWLATRQNPGGLILESAFTSIPDMAAELYPLLPARWLCKMRFATEDFLLHVSCPVLIVHSTEDEMIPFVHGERLFAAARPPKEFLRMQGSHNSGFMRSGHHYREGICRFIEHSTEGVENDDHQAADG